MECRHQGLPQAPSTLRHAAIGVAPAFVAMSLAVARPDFSGVYAARNPEQKKQVITLRIVQNDKAIESTRIEDGRTVTSNFPLNGAEGIYRTPTGLGSNGKAHFEGDDLIFESIALWRTDPSTQPMRMHIMQRWHLSSDFKTLTIRFHVDFPDSVGLNRFPPYGWTETYLRTDSSRH